MAPEMMVSVVEDSKSKIGSTSQSFRCTIKLSGGDRSFGDDLFESRYSWDECLGNKPLKRV